MYTNTRRWWKLSAGLIGVVVLLFLWPTTPLSAQGNCTQVVNELRAAIEKCRELNSNYACYGRVRTSALPTSERFNRPGDRLPVNVLQTILTEQPTGAAFMYLHLRDQQDPVKVILYGGVELNPVGQNAFIFRYEDNTPLCADTPPGLVVQTEAGQRGRITVNGVDIELESTAFITMQSPEAMTVANIAGQVTVNVPNLGVRQPLPVGQQVPITQRNGVPVAVGQPTPTSAANSTVIQWLTEDADSLGRLTDSACGGQLAYGQTLTGQNVTSGEECLYTFNGAAGDVVTINLAATAGSLNPWLDLRGPDERLVKANDNVSESDQNSLICNRALPVTGVYTIVARPVHNDSAGSFQLTLNRATACTPPPPQCEVVTGAVVMRTGPGVDNATIVQTLATGARFRPLARLAGERWLQIALLPTGEQGWISVNPYEILCDVNLDELPALDTPAAPEAVITPPPPPTPACFRVQPADWCAYRVRGGDTLTDIARRSGASLRRLREVNCRVFDDLIRIGEILFVPCPPPTRTPTPTPPTPTCETLLITGLSHEPTEGGIRVYWQATGGCDPIQGQITSHVPDSDYQVRSFTVTGRAGSLLIPYPHLQNGRAASTAAQCTTEQGYNCPTTTCVYTLGYTLVLTDSSKQSVQASRTLNVEYRCPVTPKPGTIP